MVDQIRQPNLVARFAQGVQTGNALQQLRSQRADAQRQVQARNALAQLVSGQGDENTLADLAQADPNAAMQFQQFQGQQQQAAQAQEAQAEAQAALQVKTALQTGNLPLAAQTILQLPDSPQKQQALAALQQGDVDTVSQLADGVIEGATRMGILQAPQKPQSPVSLSPGARLVDPQTGQQIAQGGEKREPTGRFRSEVDDFGTVTIVDTVTGEIVERADRQTQASPSQPPTGSGDVFGAVQAGTGPVASIQSGINNVIGPLVAGVPFEKTARSRAAIRNFNQEAKTALVNNPRFPVAEQEIVQRILPDPDKFFQDPDAARAQLLELRSFLLNKREQNLQSIQGGRVTSKEVGDLSNQVAAIDRVLGLMGPPEGGTNLPEGVPPGSERIGTFQGKPAFRTPDGKTVVVE